MSHGEVWDQRWCVVVMCHEEFVNYANLINISGCGYNHICIIWISALTIQIQNMCGQAHSQIFGLESWKSHEKTFLVKYQTVLFISSNLGLTQFSDLRMTFWNLTKCDFAPQEFVGKQNFLPHATIWHLLLLPIWPTCWKPKGW